MTHIDEAVRHDLASAPLPPPVEQVRGRARRRRLRCSAATLVAVLASVGAGAIAIDTSRHTTSVNVNVNPTVSPTSEHATTPNTSNSGPTSSLPQGDRVPNGPLSRALERLVAPFVPKGAALSSAQDIIGDPSVAEITYSLPAGQQLHIVRERLTKLPGSPQQLMRDPTVDSLTRLSTGSQLLRIGHNDNGPQVILGRPNGTMLNVIWFVPTDPTAPRPSEAERKAATLVRLDWLTALVEQHLDNTSTDLK